MNTLCLFKVTVRGIGSQYKTVYVISDSMDDAYQTYRDFLDIKDYGFEHERELEKIELVAKFYTKAEEECEKLFISNSVRNLFERSKLCQDSKK